MELLRVRRLFVDEQVARFGMAGPGGQPRVTPVPFAVIDDGDDGVIVCSLDVQPRSLRAARLVNELAGAPRVSFLVDNSDVDSTRWWVQADGVAEAIRRNGNDPRFTVGHAALAQRYRHGLGDVATIVWTTVTGWNGWIASVDAASAA